MSRIQRVALATSLLPDLRSLPPKAARAALELVKPTPEETIRAIEESLEYTVAENCLERFAKLDAIAERVGFWAGMGYKIALEGDAAYPLRWKQRLGHLAPISVFVCGVDEAAKPPLIGFVGSRKADDATLQATRMLAKAISKEGFGVVSGGAKGVDLESTEAARRSVYIPSGDAEALRRTIPSSRNALLLSPYRPDASFSVGLAMARNKLIYAMADVTIVMACEEKSGGSWEGAVESLKKGFGRVTVWTGAGAPPGNEALRQLGATPVTNADELLAAAQGAPSSLFE